MFKVYELWLTREGKEVKILNTNVEGWYPVLVEDTRTGEKYTVDRQGKWESYYDNETSKQDVITKLKD